MTSNCSVRVTGLFLGLLVSGQIAYGQDQPATPAADKPAIGRALPPNEPRPVIKDDSRIEKDPAEVALARAAEKRAARQKVIDDECVIKRVMSNAEIEKCNRAK